MTKLLKNIINMFLALGLPSALNTSTHGATTNNFVAILVLICNYYNGLLQACYVISFPYYIFVNECSSSWYTTFPFWQHNIHFLQEALQNRKSDLLEWCIIFLLSIENVISVYEIIRESPVVSTWSEGTQFSFWQSIEITVSISSHTIRAKQHLVLYSVTLV